MSFTSSPWPEADSNKPLNKHERERKSKVIELELDLVVCARTIDPRKMNRIRHITACARLADKIGTDTLDIRHKDGGG